MGHLRVQGGVVTEARVVDDGDLVTSGLDLGLWLVERFLGAELAVEVEQVLETSGGAPPEGRRPERDPPHRAVETEAVDGVFTPYRRSARGGSRRTLAV
jgi:transcriptional regulator GlxA family with amidase domain